MKSDKTVAVEHRASFLVQFYSRVRFYKTCFLPSFVSVFLPFGLLIDTRALLTSISCDFLG